MEDRKDHFAVSWSRFRYHQTTKNARTNQRSECKPHFPRHPTPEVCVL